MILSNALIPRFLKNAGDLYIRPDLKRVVVLHSIASELY